MKFSHFTSSRQHSWKLEGLAPIRDFQWKGGGHIPEQPRGKFIFAPSEKNRTAKFKRTFFRLEPWASWRTILPQEMKKSWQELPEWAKFLAVAIVYVNIMLFFIWTLYRIAGR